jgi:hypothetical protein
MTTTVPRDLAERTEIGAYVDFATCAPTAVRDALGIVARDIGAGLALTIRADQSNFFNRAGGFDAAQPITADTLAPVGEFYREQGVPLGSIMIEPALLPPDWPEIAAKCDLTEGSRFVKLGCDVPAGLSGPAGGAAVEGGLRVALVEQADAHEWGTVMMAAFGFPDPGMIDVAAACVGRPNWRQYAVWEGERIIAVGSTYTYQGCVDMFGGATLPEARGRGAQSALLTARVRGAEADGARWLVAETGAEGPGEHNTSLRNMLRAGFERLYERVSWRWRAES